MKFNRKLLAALLSVLMLVGAMLPAASAAELSATYSAPNYYSIATTAYSRMLLFQNGVVPAADQNQKWGLIDAAGAVKVPFQYAELEALGNGLFRVSDAVGGYSSWENPDAREGVIDASGAFKIPMTAADISCYNGIIQVYGENNSFYHLSDLSPATREEMWGGAESDQFPGYDYGYSIGDGYYSVYKDGAGRGLLDSNKNVVFAPGEYDGFEVIIHDGKTYFLVSDKDYQKALLDSNKKEIIPFGAYGNINTSRSDGYLEVSKDEQTGLADLTGKLVIPMGNYQEIGGVSPKGYVSVTSYEQDWRTVPTTYSNFSSTLFDLSGKAVKTWTDRVVTTETYFRDLVFSLDVDKDSYDRIYGMMDETGKVLLNNEYTYLNPDYDSVKGDYTGYVVVSKPQEGSDWAYLSGLVGADYKTLLDTKYTDLTNLGGDRYKVYDGAHYGVFSTQGSVKEVIPVKYQDMRVYTRGFIELYDGTYSSIVDIDNTVVVPASTEKINMFRNDGRTLESNLSYAAYTAPSWDGYAGDVYPFVSKTASGYTTTYADYSTGKVLGSLPYYASNITSDGRFVYRAANGLFGFGQVTGYANADAPASGAVIRKSGIPTNDAVTVDGKAVTMEAYKIDGSNYFKLRDLAMVVNGTAKQFAVDYNDAQAAAELTSGKAYVPNGYELQAGSADGSVTAIPSNNKIVIDGQVADLVVYKIGGNNYFKLRDLCAAFDIGCSYDAGTVVVDTSIGYTPN